MTDPFINQIDHATTTTKLSDLVAKYGKGSVYGDRAAARLDELRHQQTLPRAWYRDWTFWIAVTALLISILGWLFPRGH